MRTLDAEPLFVQDTPMKGSWIAKFADTGVRLDVFLSTQPTGLTRNQAKKQIEAGAFLMNGKQVSAHYALKEGDRVEKQTSRTTPASTTNKETKKQRPSSTADLPPLRIIKETEGWIVLDKPCDVLMHPDHEDAGATLIDAVIAHAPQVAHVGEDPSRPGIMSRLDKDVSGLVVIAKTPEALEHLKRQFAEHTVTKQYIALVHGTMPKDEGDLKFRIARSTTKARMAARPVESEGGQAAWTHYAVEQRFTGATLLRLEIFSGRTHQIRAHLHAFGHPVIGDPLYVLKQTKRNVKNPPRLFLQSVHLAFNDPATSERVDFTLPLDPAFDEMIKTLSSRV